MSDQEFVVRDRRHFNEQGEPEAGKEEERQATDKDAVDGGQKSEETAGERRGSGGDCSDSAQLPEISFSTFILSLSSSVLMHLGDLPDPYTQERKKNLPLAKQTIDIIGMLQDKTRGNLSAEEDNLVKNLLYEMRMKYVAACKG